jgi:hypothetical protein
MKVFRFFCNMIVACIVLLGFAFLILAVIGLIKFIW